jgi:transcription termination/antitermination protein NusG
LHPYTIERNNNLFESKNDLTSTVYRHWYAVYTASCQEKRVAQHLSTREIDHFLPVSRNPRRWKNGCTVVCEQPLFPGYLFVKIQRTDRVKVLELPGVHSIVGNGREPTPLPGDEIETLRQGIDLLNAEPCPFLNVGEKAKVIRGPLQGMTGIIVRKKSGLRLILSLDLIMKSVSVEVDAADLEAVNLSAIGSNNLSSILPAARRSGSIADPQSC